MRLRGRLPPGSPGQSVSGRELLDEFVTVACGCQTLDAAHLVCPEVMIGNRDGGQTRENFAFRPTLL
jgi:hypothetical protein